MKQLFIFAFATIFIQQAFAQQRPHYTQYILNNYILNPALTGIENYTDVKMSARDQWVGLEGAPRTAYVSIHGPIGKKDYKTTATSFQVPGDNPRGTSYWENYTPSEPHHGVGMSVINDETGLFNRFTATASYAYHLGLSPKTNIAAGFAAGVSRFSRNLAKSDFGGGVNIDPAQGNYSNISRTKPELSAGLWLYSAHFFAGASAQQIIHQNVSFVDNSGYESKMVPHYFVTTGYRFLLSDDINALPSVMMKYISGTPTSPQFDFNLKMQYQDLMWLGTSYRVKDGFAAMAGLNVNNTFNVGYAYDYTTSRLNTASKGTHEIMIGFLLGNKYDDSCPRNVW